MNNTTTTKAELNICNEELTVLKKDLLVLFYNYVESENSDDLEERKSVSVSVRRIFEILEKEITV